MALAVGDDQASRRRVARCNGGVDTGAKAIVGSHANLGDGTFGLKEQVAIEAAEEDAIALLVDGEAEEFAATKDGGEEAVWAFTPEDIADAGDGGSLRLGSGGTLGGGGRKVTGDGGNLGERGETGDILRVEPEGRLFAGVGEGEEIANGSLDGGTHLEDARTV